MNNSHFISGTNIFKPGTKVRLTSAGLCYYHELCNKKKSPDGIHTVQLCPCSCGMSYIFFGDSEDYASCLLADSDAFKLASVFERTVNKVDLP